MWVQSLGQEDPLEKGMGTHSSILACRIPWREEPARLQSMGSQRVGHDWSSWAGTHERINGPLRGKKRDLSLGMFQGKFQFSSVAQSCPTLCDPMNRSTPGLPVHHHLPEFTQTHVHRVSDAIQPSHPLLSPFSPSPNPSQHQSLFQWVNSSHEVAKVLEFQLQESYVSTYLQALSSEQTWPTLYPWTSNCEKTNFCCPSHRVYWILCGQPITQTSDAFRWFHDNQESQRENGF